MIEKGSTEAQVVRGLPDYLSFIGMHVSSGFTIYSDIVFGQVCYNYARESHNDFTPAKRVKFATLSAIIFFSVLSPYFLYYSSYMKLLLFKDSYEEVRFKSLTKWARFFLSVNLTFFGGLYFILFDLIAKILALILALTLPSFLCVKKKWLAKLLKWYEDFMFWAFDLNPQNLKSFDMQKKIVVPMFTNIPMLLI